MVKVVGGGWRIRKRKIKKREKRWRNIKDMRRGILFIEFLVIPSAVSMVLGNTIFNISYELNSRAKVKTLGIILAKIRLKRKPFNFEILLGVDVTGDII